MTVPNTSSANDAESQLLAEYQSFKELVSLFGDLSGSPEYFLTLRVANNRVSVVNCWVAPLQEGSGVWPQDELRQRQERGRPGYTG